MGQVNELKDFSRGQLDSALMKIGHDVGLGTAEGIQSFLRGELIVSEPERKWREKNGVIYFSVTSDGTTGSDDGTTGSEWIKRFADIGDYAKSVLRSPDFKPTNGVTTEIAVLKGMLFENDDRTTKNIRAEAKKRGFTKPNAEVACLIREKFTDEELEAMGLWWIIVMHEPIKDSDGDPSLLGASRDGDGSWLLARWGDPGRWWHRDDGFAFAVSQVSAEA
jgi:hypothetical protein